MNVYNKFIRDYIFYLFHITFPSSTRRATCNRKWDWSKDVISIHVPTKGATAYQSWRRNRIRHFNPRSHEGSDDNSNITSRLSLHFNPRSHEGSDPCPIAKRGEVGISIHAPTKGATYMVTGGDLFDGISIHAPTKGATKQRRWNDGVSVDFNPRSHEGSDFRQSNTKGDISCISIHAPTKGATLQKSLSKCMQIYFNPRSHEGSDSGTIRSS